MTINLKALLGTQAETPKAALAATPLAALGTGVTDALHKAADAIPTTVEIPDIPVAPPGQVTEMITKVEAALPAPGGVKLPSFLGLLGGVAPATKVKVTGVTVTGAGAAAPPAPRVAPKLIYE